MIKMLNEKIDVRENNILNHDPDLLAILLKDNTTKKNIIWATDIYENRGFGYRFKDEMKINYITSYNGMVIKPRTMKSKQDQLIRIKDKAEVFTPSWMCNMQNNLVDKSWFGYDPKFNKELKENWKTYKKNIDFRNLKWEDYVSDLRLEISCGEAPYLVSRYDTVTGKIISVNDRIGLLDRKLRIVNENVDDEEQWLEWTKMAYKSVYGFEWQGDSLLIARENLLYTFIDNYNYKFDKDPSKKILEEIAEIISWNIFQMDGLKFVVPNTCSKKEYEIIDIFGHIESNECAGCKKNNIHNHNGIYAKTMNWKTGRKIKFITIYDRSGK